MKKKAVLRDLMALGAGASFPLAFAPFDYSWVALGSLALLFFVWVNASPVRALLRGYLFGLGQFSSGVYWIFISLHDFGVSSPLAAVLVTVFCVAVLSAFPAAAGYIAVLCSAKVPAVRLGIVFPAYWIILEWLRASLLFPGFPWLQSGYSQLDSYLGGIAPLVGVYGVGLAAAVTAGLLTYLLGYAARGRWLAVSVLLVLWVAGAVLAGVKWTNPVGKPFRVSLIQGNIPQAMKWLPDFKNETLRIYNEMTRQHWDSMLVVWPETAVPVYYHQVKDTLLADLGNEGKLRQTDLLIGTPVLDESSGLMFNALVSIGQAPGMYRKRHLVPFGEYLPFQPLSGFVVEFMQFPKARFSPGDNNQVPLKAVGYPLAASICYEDVFGHESLTALPEALYLVNVTNDAWFGDSIALHQNLQMARMRALETGRYLLRAANTGITAIISPTGALIKVAPLFQRTTLSGAIVPMGGSTPFIHYGDYPVLILVGMVALVFGLRFLYAVNKT